MQITTNPLRCITNNNNNNYILGLDPGYRNMGLAMFDPVTQKEVKTWTEDILGDKKMKEVKGDSNRMALILGFYHKNKEHFDKCNMVVIEQQMTRSLNCLVFYLAGLLYPKKVIVIHPMVIKRFFRLPPTGNHEQNKQLAKRFTHKDDHNIADACLLAMYAMQNYNKKLV